MTYFVAWDLTVDPGSHHPCEIDAALEAATGDAGGELLVSVCYGEYDAEPVSGYDPTEELENLSLRFPEALFTLTTADCENYLPPEKNHGVFPGKTLPEVLEGAQQEFGGMSAAEMRERRMAGHWVASRY